MKKCNKCKTYKDDSEFSKNSRTCRVCVSEYRKSRKELPHVVAKKKEANRKQHRMEKIRVLDHYGMSCACCGESQIEFLTIDHMNGDGARQHKENGTRSGKLYVWLIKNKFPFGFQTLCWNCNCAKRNGNSCPHEKMRERGNYDTKSIDY